MKRIEKIANFQINGEHIFIIALTTSLIISFIINTTFMPFIEVKHLNWVNYLMIGMLIVKVYIFDNFNLKQYLIITIILLLSFISWRKTNYSNVMVLITFILGAKDIDFRKIVKCYFNTNLTLLLLTIIYSLTGIIQNLIFFRDEIRRFSLGIDYPTDLAAYVFFLILAYCYLYYSSLNFKKYVSFFLISLITYKITNSRLDLILIILIIPVMMLTKRSSKNGKSTPVSDYVVDHYWSLTIIVPYIYILLNFYFQANDRVFFLLNKLLSGRLEYGNLALKKYGISMLGQKINEYGWGGINGLYMSKNNISKYFFIDSSYIRLIVIYGIFLGLVIFLIMVATSIKGGLNNNYVLSAIIFLISISSIVDQHMLEISYNIFFLAFLALNSNQKTGGYSNEKEVLNQ